MTFEEYLTAQGKSKATVSHYSYCLSDFEEWLKTQQIEPETASGPDVMRYLEILQLRDLDNKTRGVRLTIIHHWFDYLLQEDRRADHPSRHIKLRGIKQDKLYPVLNRQQLESLYLDYVVPDQHNPFSNRNWFRSALLSKRRNKVIMGLIVYQGLNTSEVQRMDLKDLDLRAGTVYVGGSRKSNERTLELKPGQIMDLMEYQLQTRAEILAWYKEPITKLFLTVPQSGKQVAINSGEIWKPLTADLRQQQKAFISFKQVRTSVIVGWLGSYNLRQVQYMAGHRFVSSTERYYRHQIEGLQADIDRFHPLG